MKPTFALLMAFILTACTGQPDRSSAQRTLDTVRAAYLVANLSVTACVALQPPVCSNTEVVAKVQQAGAAVWVAIDAAETILATASSDAPDVQKAIVSAQVALVALTQVLSDYRLR